MKKNLIGMVVMAFLLLGGYAYGGCLRVTFPDRGGQLTLGFSHNITWRNSCGNPVKIVLKKGASSLGNIATNLPASRHSYQWTVGHYQGGTAPPGNDYRILIKTMDGTQEDMSDNNFSISAPHSLPDLIVSNIRLINHCKIRVTIKNAGSNMGVLPDSAYDKTKGVGIQMYNGNKPWGGIRLFAVDPAMKLKKPGASVSWVWFPAAAKLKLGHGVHLIRVIVDSNNAVTESNETNNVTIKMLTCH